VFIALPLQFADGFQRLAHAGGRGHPSSTPKAEFERFSRPGANVINKLALQRQFFCSGTT
jgi:hypothetical protein